jgi:tol-pal system protein YbgF
MLKLAIAFLCSFVVTAAEAQVRVVDSSPQSVRSGVVRPQENIDQKTESYNQIQALMREVSELRALAEEQGHEISRLKQLQLDNYVDLDRRLSLLNANSTARARTTEAPADSSSMGEITSLANNGMTEADEYKAAYDLLRQRQVDQSLLAFKNYLKKYPTGEFSANSCYWLGEIFLLKDQLPQARDWFSKLLQDFPASNKVPDAKFKLGKVYHLMGDKKHAKPLLDEAATGLGDSARLAKQYLKDNF